MKIGTIDLGERPVFLAPMEDVTDISFRLMCKRFGADMVYTEFVSADALIRSVNKTQQKLNVADEERPVAIQIYVRSPYKYMAVMFRQWSKPRKFAKPLIRTFSISISVALSNEWQAKEQAPACCAIFH